MKKIIKRTFTIILALTLCCTCLPLHLVSAADESVAGSAELRAMEVLRLFEIIPEDYYDYNANLTKGATRADFAASLAALMNLKGAAGRAYYYDVPETHWAFNEIGALTANGVLSGEGEKLFRPDDVIEKDEAYKMLVTALGYGTYAEYRGGYPSGYQTVAGRLQLTGGLSSGTEVTRGDMFLLLYTAMTAEMLVPTIFHDNATTYRESEDTTLLSLYHDIYYDKGVVNGVNGTALDGKSLDCGMVRVGDVNYNTDVSLQDYIAEEIEFFYRKTSKDETGRILWAAPTGRNLVLNITANYDASFDAANFVLNYTDDSDRTSTVSLKRDMTMLYNGEVITTGYDQVFNLPKYTAKLVCSSGSGSYDVAVVRAYRNIVVGSVNSADHTVYDKSNSTDKLILDENLYDLLIMRAADGTPLQFEDITQGSVLSVWQSRDGRILEVQSSTQQVSGIIDSIREETNGYILLINAVEYFLPKTVGTAASLKPGDSLTLYLDIAGEAAGYELASGKAAYTAAFLIDAEVDDSYFCDALRIKALPSSGGLQVYNCADKFMIDGVYYRSGKSAIKALMEVGEFKPQIAMIETNTNGDITMIDTVTLNVEENPETSLRVNIPYQTNLLYKSSGIFDLQSVLDNNTVIFAIPAEENMAAAEDEDFARIARSALPNDTRLNAETYKITERVGYEQFVVLRGYDPYGYKASERPLLVQSVFTGMNEDGEMVKGIQGYQGGSAVSFTATTEVDFDGAVPVEPGMVLRIKRDSKGYITDYQVLFDYRSDPVFTGDRTVNGAFRTLGGYVYDIVDGIIKIDYDLDGVIDQSTITNGVPVIVFDKENKKARIGNINDAVTYYNAQKDCSVIFMMSSYSSPQMFVLYV